MKLFTIILYTDPYGSLAKVKRDVLEKLKISQHISSASYQQGNYVFLDQEEDLPLFCQVLNGHGTNIKFVEKCSNKSSRVRSYERYAAQSDALDHMFPDNLSTLTIYSTESAAS